MTSFYFLGIGGTAMGSVAVALSQMGFRVTGSDSGVYPPMSDFLSESGITYFSSFDAAHISDFSDATIVVGNAISRGNVELEEALNQRMILKSLPEVIKENLIQQNRSLVVTGTHGKTTTTSLLSWILESGGLHPGFMLGGIHSNFNVGCRPVKNNENKNGYFVIEGDEYDTAFFDKRSKFHHYRPSLAIINNIEFDHADIFPSLDTIYRSFSQFIRLVPKNGLLLVGDESREVIELAQKSFSPVETFGFDPNSNWRAVDLEISPSGSSFTVFHNAEKIGRFKSPLFGEHNCRNSLASIAAAHWLGLTPEAIQQGLTTFKSPKRRLDVIYNQNNFTLIDDFAHHPTAILETLKSVKQMYPERRIIACFEPRSNTSTRNTFQEGFSKALNQADLIVLGPVNRPDRYSDTERLNTALLLNDLKTKGKEGYAIELPPPENYVECILNFLEANLKSGDVIVVLSNGSFGGLIPKVKSLLSDKYVI